MKPEEIERKFDVKVPEPQTPPLKVELDTLSIPKTSAVKPHFAEGGFARRANLQGAVAHRFYDRGEVVRVCCVCNSAELPEGGIIPLTREQTENLREQKYKLSHGILSANCFLEQYGEDIGTLSNLKENIIKDSERGMDREGKGFYLTCLYQEHSL